MQPGQGKDSPDFPWCHWCNYFAELIWRATSDNEEQNALILVSEHLQSRLLQGLLRQWIICHQGTDEQNRKLQNINLLATTQVS